MKNQTESCDHWTSWDFFFSCIVVSLGFRVPLPLSTKKQSWEVSIIPSNTASSSSPFVKQHGLQQELKKYPVVVSNLDGRKGFQVLDVVSDVCFNAWHLISWNYDALHILRIESAARHWAPDSPFRTAFIPVRTNCWELMWYLLFAVLKVNRIPLSVSTSPPPLPCVHHRGSAGLRGLGTDWAAFILKCSWSSSTTAIVGHDVNVSIMSSLATNARAGYTCTVQFSFSFGVWVYLPCLRRGGKKLCHEGDSSTLIWQVEQKQPLVVWRGWAMIWSTGGGCQVVVSNVDW